MKRMHIDVSVDNIDDSVKFYNILFKATPSVTHEDYAKWELKEPAVNFAISNRETVKGVNHLGIQVGSEKELGEIAAQL